ncbi:histidinol-phosphate transaminase [Paenibacillus eucommiae]|uniref:Histidinol-phosphate aminotransferase n=1 Tax=Paenibacillus eucommiae TaxID=1355755 RepID=A0ABS4J964_9BACL|nr:histidinol-phosphate transaminase [Paenibacillus eucommiae]MBP1996380.1 histidinol-phosphate aminotransferase [Paenibacillus eucommiae]
MTFILPHIEQLSTYVLGEHPPDGSSVLKLNQNESPYPPAQLVLETLRTIGEESIRRYPDTACGELRAALSHRHNVKEEQVFCGNGSSEIISLIIKVFVGPGRCIAIPDPSFSLYHSVAASYQAASIRIPLRDDYTIDTDLLIRSEADVLVLVNPNAPTGRLLPLVEVEQIVSQFRGLVVIDEAYMDFATPGSSALPLAQRYENVLILRTFSKAYALCGARVGYCIARKQLISALEKGKDIYNINAISQRLAEAALRAQTYTDRTIAATKLTRDAFSAELEQLEFEVLPSHTNFVLCTPPSGPEKYTARELYQELIKRNIYVRHFEHPRLSDKLRISIGTDEEMRLVTTALSELLN